MPSNPLRRPQRFAAWLGIFAIWLTVLVPLGSQWLAREMPPEAVICGADDHHAARPADGPAKALHHFDACGYCSLLAHFPALNGASHVDAVLSVASDGQAAAPVRHCARQIRYLRRPPRAPPPIA
ncbi:DUF2946 domain-containing protein [Paraburkholderia caballeronis]|uniref:DUF2946 domain-containing protein n=1 Tax=Paraburkholderia caballeronis TaxID=416943 RepID=A0A1H7H6S8_9BURK|nr:DUF2946 domain-containing protein [Paraburkholderia caballeronis]PXW29626.1 hypothetical protein C7403_101482 [Paraburkholderia caballeronis]PXX04885.1 hypothetical protein C7407_101482 [Paraburkholderia caballeronis]RAK05946.1 hypothetical protein C7409_101482 [Paraburkholderia caballeronis]SEB44513.1 Protein of unknown function [Paraburkholderia caballeronis]SEK45994.1 Protein of unknown function [Paraburkholderia caballeronis]